MRQNITDKGPLIESIGRLDFKAIGLNSSGIIRETTPLFASFMLTKYFYLDQTISSS